MTTWVVSIVCVLILVVIMMVVSFVHHKREQRRKQKQNELLFKGITGLLVGIAKGDVEVILPEKK